jgi:ATP-dependent DNA helicase
VFSSLAEFEGWFDFSGSAAEGEQEDPAVTQRHQVIAKLHDLLRPFLLRRLKADVEIALPRKQEVVLYAPMSDLQKTLNQQLLDKSLRVREGGLGRWGGVKCCLQEETSMHAKYDEATLV